MMFAAMSANAQWEQISNGFPVTYNNAVNPIIVSDNKIIIGYDYSGVYYFSNNGNSWIPSSLEDI